MKSFADHYDQIRNYEIEIQQFSYLTRTTHTPVKLGEVYNTSIWLFESKTPKGVLITSGWQGDEPAGWQASKILCQSLPTVSFIPFVSPICFLNRQHKNYQGKNIDRGWPEAETSEGKILQNNISDIVRLGELCFISLQEDRNRFIPYFYGWNQTVELDEMIQRKITEHFPLAKESNFGSKEGLFCEHAVRNGCKMAVQLETPADGSYTLSKRVDCQVDTVKSLMGLI